jgi:hypothetical protein
VKVLWEHPNCKITEHRSDKDLIDLIEKDKGGIFIDFIEKNSRKYVEFICENRHRQEKRRDCFITWCSECQKNSIEDCHKLAEKRGFKFLSEKYENSVTIYRWKCSNDHIWNAKYNNINEGKGCPECLKVPYEDIVAIIKKKGGSIITKKEKYDGVKTKIKFTCSEGHTCKIQVHLV